MNINADHVKHLSPALRQRLEQGLQLFKKNWTETLMAETLGQMAADHPLRYASLVEMTRLDLLQRWSRKDRVTIEQYLKTYPELGSVHTVSLDLIRWEYKVRKANGDSIKVEDYSKRFPGQYEAFRQRSLKDDLAGADNPKPGTPALTSPVAAAFNATSSVINAFGGAAQPVKGNLQSVESRGKGPAPSQTPAPQHPKIQNGRWARQIAAIATLLVMIFLGWMGSQGGFQDPKKFFSELFAGKAEPLKEDAEKTKPQKNESSEQVTSQVKSLIVKLDIGEGEEVLEPIYLDLGLGFPFWLVPAGSIPATVPFGAVPQISSANKSLSPNSSATFTFLAAGEPGLDVLNTTPQLLAGVKVGDIRRIGFASLAQQNWKLTGYEIQVNGEVLHSAKGLSIHPQQLQAEAMKKLAALSSKSSSADSELSNLRDALQFGFATDAEKARLKELESKAAITSIAEDRTLLERQLRGQSPWYSENIPRVAPATAVATSSSNLLDYLMPTANAADVPSPAPRSLRVIVLTDNSIPDSDSSNYAYFRVGGRKYLIGGPDMPLTSKNGMQVFEIDLLAGPLESSELREWGLGMLAPNAPLGKEPDRWNCRRLQVEVDGKLIYDSEDQTNDRQTLLAVRLLPPTQLDLDGSLLTNKQSSRDLFVWQSGKPSGFDPVTGIVDAVPGDMKIEEVPEPVVNQDNPPKIVIDPNIPLDDPSKLLNEKVIINSPNNILPSDPDLVGIPFINGPDPLINQLPVPLPDPRFDPSVQRQPPQIIISGPVIMQLPLPDGSNAIFNLDNSGLPFPQIETKPIGRPPQIGEIRFVELKRSSQPGLVSMMVTWTTFPSNENGVSHYDVMLQGLLDDLSGPDLTPRSGQSEAFLNLGPIPPGIGMVFVQVPQSYVQSYRFVAPVVIPRMIDGQSGQFKFGPARSTGQLQNNVMDANFTDPKQLQGPKLELKTPIEFKTHSSLDIFTPKGALLVPVAPLSPEVRLSLMVNDLKSGDKPARIRFYTSFGQGFANNNSLEYRVQAFANQIPSTAGGASSTIILNDVAVANRTPTNGYYKLDGSDFATHLVTVKIPQSARAQMTSSSRWNIELTITMRKFEGDPTRPPIVFDAMLLNND